MASLEDLVAQAEGRDAIQSSEEVAGKLKQKLEHIIATDKNGQVRLLASKVLKNLASSSTEAMEI